MKRLLGWFRNEGDGQALARWLRSVAPDAGTLCELPELGGLARDDGGCVQSGPEMLAFVGRPRLPGDRPGARSPEETANALLAAYRKRGEAFLEQVQGDFVIAVIDGARRRLLLALDRLGQHALYHAQAGEGRVFGTRLGPLIRAPGVDDRIAPQAIFDYVYYHHCPSPGTIYRGVEKLEGGEYLLVEPGRVVRRRYWMPSFSRNEALGADEAGVRLMELLEQAVRRQLETAPRPGAFLSGGLDSSTVSGLLARARPDDCHTFSIGFPVAGYDETEYARAAVEHFGTRHHEFVLRPEHTVDAVAEIARFYDEPFGNSSALPALFCARLARENGVEQLLAGDGGDELFAGNERYQRQLLFERYQRAPAPLRGLLEGTLKAIPLGDGVDLLRKARRYVEQARTPLPDRLQDYNFLHRHAAQSVFDAGFLEQVDTERPLALLREVYARPEEGDALDRMLYMDWKTTLHDNDLVKVNEMCQLAGIDVRYPMLDDDVVAFSTAVPSSLKMKGGELRGFYKEAVRGFLPEKIINKSKHGFGLPFGVWLADYDPLRELAYDSIAALKGRGYFRPEFLDHAMEMHRKVHAAYYGELIWILMMLEQWFQGHERVDEARIAV